MTVPEFAEAVQAFCKQFSCSVTSWGRTKSRNKKVGGVEGSPHTHWVGADVVYDVPVEKASLDQFADSIGLYIVHEGDHDHLQPKNWRNHV